MASPYNLLLEVNAKQHSIEHEEYLHVYKHILKLPKPNPADNIYQLISTRSEGD